MKDAYTPPAHILTREDRVAWWRWEFANKRAHLEYLRWRAYTDPINSAPAPHLRRRPHPPDLQGDTMNRCDKCDRQIADDAGGLCHGCIDAEWDEDINV